MATEQILQLETASFIRKGSPFEESDMNLQRAFGEHFPQQGPPTQWNAILKGRIPETNKKQMGMP